MGSTMDSRYMVCPHCFCQFDWEDGTAQAHDKIACAKSQEPVKQVWVIDYESSRWCGGQSHCLVWAESADEAEELAADHMQDYMYQMFSDEDREMMEEEDGDELDLDCAYTVNSIEPLIGSEYEKYVTDPVQQQEFYPYVN